jgi:hypothetical protein
VRQKSFVFPILTAHAEIVLAAKQVFVLCRTSSGPEYPVSSANISRIASRFGVTLRFKVFSTDRKFISYAHILYKIEMISTFIECMLRTGFSQGKSLYAFLNHGCINSTCREINIKENRFRLKCAATDNVAGENVEPFVEGVVIGFIS